MTRNWSCSVDRAAMLWAVLLFAALVGLTSQAHAQIAVAKALAVQHTRLPDPPVNTVVRAVFEPVGAQGSRVTFDGSSQNFIPSLRNVIGGDVEAIHSERQFVPWSGYDTPLCRMLTRTDIYDTPAAFAASTVEQALSDLLVIPPVSGPAPRLSITSEIRHHWDGVRTDRFIDLTPSQQLETFRLTELLLTALTVWDEHETPFHGDAALDLLRQRGASDDELAELFINPFVHRFGEPHDQTAPHEDAWKEMKLSVKFKVKGQLSVPFIAKGEVEAEFGLEGTIKQWESLHGYLVQKAGVLIEKLGKALERLSNRVEVYIQRAVEFANEEVPVPMNDTLTDSVWHFLRERYPLLFGWLPATPQRTGGHDDGTDDK